MTEKPSTEDIRSAVAASPKTRERDMADKLGIAEAELVAAYAGDSAMAVTAHPDAVMALAQRLGEVMALTRNASCVHEKVGAYDNYHPGDHAAMVLTEDIDLRIFPSHWRHAFLMKKPVKTGVRRSIQVFDAAGDAVHKIFLRDGSDLEAWRAAWTSAESQPQMQTVTVDPRKEPEGAKSAPQKLDILRKEWARLTDTHQFLRLCAKLKMNRLGAYRIAGDPFVRALDPSAVDSMLRRLAETGTEVMIFVGNRGCIQIHTGPVVTLHPMGPWQNVMDPGFNLHLRLDHVTEVWAVEKPTQRGPALSVEAFDADGSLIFQVFGIGKEGRDSRPAWKAIVENLAGLPEAVS